MIKELRRISAIFFVLILFGAFYVAQHRPLSKTATFVYSEIVVVAKPVSKSIAISKPSTAIIEPYKQSVLPLMPPKIIYSVAPIYPQAALEAGAQGIVIVETNILPSGIPNNVRIKTSSGNGELDNSALAAVSQWRFSPATQNGQSQNSIFEVPVRFVWH